MLATLFQSLLNVVRYIGSVVTPLGLHSPIDGRTLGRARSFMIGYLYHPLLAPFMSWWSARLKPLALTNFVHLSAREPLEPSKMESNADQKSHSNLKLNRAYTVVRYYRYYVHTDRLYVINLAIRSF